MPINWKLQKFREMQMKRANEKKAVRDHWMANGGFKPTEDLLKAKYKLNRIRPEDTGF